MGFWGWFIIALIILIFIKWFVSPKDKEKKCAWCDGYKLDLKSGSEGNRYWEYRNKDGSRDKRVKDNYQKAAYFSEHKCVECSGTTKFSHYVNRAPSHNVKVWKRTLVTEGDNDRKGKDWKDSSRVNVNPNQANRKN